MAITIIPNENVRAVVSVPICFEASANLVIPQEDIRGIDIPSSGTGWTFTSAPDGEYFTNITGATTPPGIGAGVVQANPIFSLQPFHISALNWSFDTPVAPNRFYAAHWGVFDDAGNFWGWYLYKNCGNQSPSNCG